MKTFLKIAGMAAFALAASLLHKIEFSDQAVTFKRLANGEQVAEVNVLGNVAKAVPFEEVIREGEETFGSSESEAPSPTESRNENIEHAAEGFSGTLESIEQEAREENFHELFESQSAAKSSGTDGELENEFNEARESVNEITSSEEYRETEWWLESQNEPSPREHSNEVIEAAGEGMNEHLEAVEEEETEENFRELFESQEEGRD